MWNLLIDLLTPSPITSLPQSAHLLACTQQTTFCHHRARVKGPGAPLTGRRRTTQSPDVLGCSSCGCVGQLGLQLQSERCIYKERVGGFLCVSECFYA